MSWPCARRFGRHDLAPGAGPARKDATDQAGATEDPGDHRRIAARVALRRAVLVDDERRDNRAVRSALQFLHETLETARCQARIGIQQEHIRCPRRAHPKIGGGCKSEIPIASNEPDALGMAIGDLLAAIGRMVVNYDGVPG